MTAHDQDHENEEDETSFRASDPSPAPARSAGFQPGDVLAGRYRMVGVIGKGGMGEVFRVQDLTLDQEVALKFLPEELASDPHRLSLFHKELRIARQVTHPNVCRVYDLGEVDGRPFLSMEYVQGEDLASLLRRVGRLPEERGLEIARQLCAGLAAAHDQNVLHRDLKPANVLIDENGKVRITDFGLASLADDDSDAGSGTPAYMAPEQLSSQEVSVQSELFSLGLILYELFTGRRALDAKSIPEIVSAHKNWSVPTPSSSVRELSAETEAAILRCLESSPADRPSSALTLSAMLPGGDALAEALAAGRTPSPDLVAAAGEKKALPAPWAVGAVAVALLGLVLVYLARAPVVLINQVPFAKPPAVLIDRAETIIQELGFDAKPHAIYGFTVDSDYLEAVADEDDGFEVLKEGRPPAIRFWYRESPEPLVPINQGRARPNQRDPPPDVAGMISLELDAEGRLLELRAVPGETRAPTEAARTDWSSLLAHADITDTAASTAPERRPPVFADTRAAWLARGMRFEAAAIGNRVVWFKSFGAWETIAESDAAEVDSARDIAVFIAPLIMVLVLSSAVFLAYRNLRLGRGDKTRALGLGAVMFFLNLAAWILLAERYGDPNIELDHFIRGCSNSLFPGALTWLIYMALEPYVRRLWPQGLIGWTRLFSGHTRDPLVGRDLLIGAAVGTLMALSGPVYALTTSQTPTAAGLIATAGFRFSLLVLTGQLITSISNAFLIVLIFVLLWMVVRRAWVALGLLGMLLGLLIGVQVEEPTLGGFVYLLLILGMGAGVLWRFGVLALVTALFFEMVLRLTPFASDWSAWYATPTQVSLGALVVLTGFAFISSRAGEPLFGRRILPD